MRLIQWQCTPTLSPGRGDSLAPRWEESHAGESSRGARLLLPAYEPSFGARPVPGRSGSDSLLVPEPSPGRRLHSDPLRAGTSRAPDAGGFRGAMRVQSSGRPLLGGEGRGEGGPPFSLHLSFFRPRIQ